MISRVIDEVTSFSTFIIWAQGKDYPVGNYHPRYLDIKAPGMFFYGGVHYFFLYESLTNMLELKGFRFSLWQVFLPCVFLYNGHVLPDTTNIGS